MAPSLLWGLHGDKEQLAAQFQPIQVVAGSLAPAFQEQIYPLAFWSPVHVQNE